MAVGDGTAGNFMTETTGASTHTDGDSDVPATQEKMENKAASTVVTTTASKETAATGAPAGGESGSQSQGGRARPPVRESRCRLCREKVKRVDYKDTETLLSFCRSRGRIMARKRSGNCAKHQRLVQRAMKQARHMSLLSYIDGDRRGAGRYGPAW